MMCYTCLNNTLSRRAGTVNWCSAFANKGCVKDLYIAASGKNRNGDRVACLFRCPLHVLPSSLRRECIRSCCSSTLVHRLRCPNHLSFHFTFNQMLLCTTCYLSFIYFHLFTASHTLNSCKQCLDSGAASKHVMNGTAHTAPATVIRCACEITGFRLYVPEAL